MNNRQDVNIYSVASGQEIVHGNPLYLLNLRQTVSVGVQDIENRTGSGPGSVNTGVPLGHKAFSGSLVENSYAHICVSWRQSEHHI